MKKIFLISAALIISAISLSAQNKLQVSEKDMNSVIFREAGDNETIVEIQSNVALEFESTMDKSVNISQTYEESGYTFYRLKFPTGAKYRGRKLKIKSVGCNTETLPLDLKSKVPFGLEIRNLSAKVGVGCYYEHLNKGNEHFDGARYADAKDEYYLALDCPEGIPEDNDLSKKIEEAGAALDSKRAADNFYNEGKPLEALREYEKVQGLSPSDTYIKERIALCNQQIPNLPRTIRVKTIFDGKPMADVGIQAETYKVDKKTGDLVRDKKGELKKDGFKAVAEGKTNERGERAITLKRVTKNLKFYKSIDTNSGYSAEVELSDNTDEVEVVLKEGPTPIGWVNSGVELLNVVGGLFGKGDKK